MFKTVAIITNTSKKDASTQTLILIEWLKKKGVKIKLAHDDISELRCEGEACDRTRLIDGTDLVITMGGDGTVLKAVSLIQDKNTPIIAINYGKFGFLQEVDPLDLYADLEQLFNGNFHLEERRLLDIRFGDEKHLALNDLVLTHDGFRIMEIQTYINGTFFYEYAADGLAVATSTGAAAYSFSAGGPFVNPTLNVNLLTPLNPHSLLNRSIVLGPDDVVGLKTASIDGKQKISSDGMLVHCGESLDIEVGASDKTIKLVKLRDSNFFSFLRKKLLVLCGVKNAI